MKKGRDNEYIASVVFVYMVYGFWGQSCFTNSDSRLSFPRISQLCACFIVMFDQQLVICYTYTGRQIVHAFFKWIHQDSRDQIDISSWLIQNKSSSSNEVLSFVLRFKDAKSRDCGDALICTVESDDGEDRVEISGWDLNDKISITLRDSTSCIKYILL